MERIIYTVGHSNHPISGFLEMLDAFYIRHLADVRLLPGSRTFPQYNQDALQASLSEHKIDYTHFKKLGGRRTPLPGSLNTGWKSPAFRGYADYMESNAFQNAAGELEALAKSVPVAFMCAEAVWWSCHRSIIADYLKHKGWTVQHIIAKGKATQHPYTSPVRIIEGKLSYPGTGDMFGSY